jgi:hypothetical protein
MAADGFACEPTGSAFAGNRVCSVENQPHFALRTNRMRPIGALLASCGIFYHKSCIIFGP